MINYEDTEDQIKCPYCKSVDSCEHLFAVYDVTFDTNEGGFLYNDDRVEEVLRHFFISVINSYGLSDDFEFPEYSELNDIWADIIADGSAYMDDNIFYENNFFLPSINRYLFQKLNELESPENGEFEGGPGQSSAYDVYYSDNPQKLADDLVNSISADLNRYLLEFANSHEMQKGKRKKKRRK